MNNDPRGLPSMLGLKIATAAFGGLFLSELAWDIYTKTVLFPGQILGLCGLAAITLLCSLIAWGLE